MRILRCKSIYYGFILVMFVLVLLIPSGDSAEKAEEEFAKERELAPELGSRESLPFKKKSFMPSWDCIGCLISCLLTVQIITLEQLEICLKSCQDQNRCCCP